MRDIRICVAGADGRMGSAVLKEAESKGMAISGAVVKDGNECIGQVLSDVGICRSDAVIHGSSSLAEALEGSDVYITFTNPQSELENIPRVVDMKKRVVMGTTGFSAEEMERIEAIIRRSVPAVISPNLSIGVNVLFRLAELMEAIPQDYDVSIFEVHHTGKVDSPSGTAKKLAEIVSEAKGYDKNVHGREGSSRRAVDELEILSARIGGVPGLHDLMVAGPHEMLRVEHTAFSRRAFAHGAIHAAMWIMEKEEPEVYSMLDVLGI
ncbi:MAG: 4-hydroxy-tetrahydrodipicolinate reductase [Thermoplasmata archaeon]